MLAIIREVKFFAGTFLCVLIMAGSLFWTHIPTVGSLAYKKPPASFSFGYFGQQQEQMNLAQWAGNSSADFYAAPDRFYRQEKDVPPAFFYPVYDNSSSLEEYDRKYPHLPWEAIPTLGKSVYSFNFGNACFLFLNALRISNEDLSQLEWLQKTIAANPQTFTIVFLHHDPGVKAVWDTLKKSGVHLVFMGGQVYAPRQVVAQEPSHFNVTSLRDWGVWDAPAQFKEPHMLLITAEEQRLAVKAQDPQGKALDQMELDLSNIDDAHEVQEKNLIGLQAKWRYRAGGSDSIAVIPEGLDVSGEAPVLQRFPLPPQDWRSVSFDDSSWQTGRAPLGHTVNQSERKLIQTELPKDAFSPTYFFRKTFTLEEDPADISDMILYLTYEDGCVVYINGNEAYRNAIRTGWLTHQSLAMPNESILYQQVRIKNTPSWLNKGKNIIAVEVHRSHPKSPNLLFDLNLSYVKKVSTP